MKKEPEGVEALGVSTTLWRATVDAIGDPVAVIDGQQKVVWCNKSMADFLGKPLGDIIGQPCYRLVREHIGSVAGSHFDPRVVESFSRMLETEAGQLNAP